MRSPLSIRFELGILDRLRRRAARTRGATPSGLAQRLVDEGLRQAEHPGVVFKDGPSGRRAALALGPDVWEVIRALREIDERGEDAIAATSELLQLTPARVRVAVRYYADHVAEINAEISEADTTSRAAEASLARLAPPMHVTREPARLLLDEMFAPRIAAELHRRGHDVLALVEDLAMQSLSGQLADGYQGVITASGRLAGPGPAWGHRVKDVALRG